MSRKGRGPYLYFKKPEYLPDGRLRKRGVWIVRDKSASFVTGCAEDEREAAEAALAEYITRKYSFRSNRARRPSDILVTDVLGYYAQEVVPEHARPQKTGERLLQLGAFWQDRFLSEIAPSTCREYVAWRLQHDWKSARPEKTGTPARKMTTGGARRELEDLKAAVNFYIRAGLCIEPVHVHLPAKRKGRTEWMTRSEAARLLWICWRYREVQTRTTGRTAGQPKETAKYPLRHLVRFILVGLYTGSRSDDICKASFEQIERRGYIDLDDGVWYKKPNDHVESNKRAPDIRLPPRLLAICGGGGAWEPNISSNTTESPWRRSTRALVPR